MSTAVIERAMRRLQPSDTGSRTYRPMPLPMLRDPTTAFAPTAEPWPLAARCRSAPAARTASAMVSSGVPRIIDCATASRAASSVLATVMAMLWMRPRVRPT